MTHAERLVQDSRSRRALACKPRPVLNVDLPARSGAIVIGAGISAAGGGDWRPWLSGRNRRDRRWLSLVHGGEVSWRRAERRVEASGDRGLNSGCEQRAVSTRGHGCAALTWVQERVPQSFRGRGLEKRKENASTRPYKRRPPTEQLRQKLNRAAASTVVLCHCYQYCYWTEAQPTRPRAA